MEEIFICKLDLLVILHLKLQLQRRQVVTFSLLPVTVKLMRLPLVDLYILMPEILNLEMQEMFTSQQARRTNPTGEISR